MSHLHQSLGDGLIGTLSQAIGLGMVGTGLSVVNTASVQQCLKISFEFSTLVSYYLYRRAMSANNVSIEEICCGFGAFVGNSYCLDVFRNVVNRSNNVAIT